MGYGKSSSPLNLPKKSALAKPTSAAGDEFLDLLLLFGDLLGRESHFANPRMNGREPGTVRVYSIPRSSSARRISRVERVECLVPNFGATALLSGANSRCVRPPRAQVDQERIRKAVREILIAVGEDPDREGLLETPDRVARMYAEIFGGLHTDPAVHLQKTFTQKHDEMVLVKDIEFASCCEHHLLPFTGKAHIAYLPNGQIVGLVEAGAGGRCGRPPAAGAGADDRGDRRSRS